MARFYVGDEVTARMAGGGVVGTGIFLVYDRQRALDRGRPADNFIGYVVKGRGEAERRAAEWNAVVPPEPGYADNNQGEG